MDVVELLYVMLTYLWIIDFIQQMIQVNRKATVQTDSLQTLFGEKL